MPFNVLLNDGVDQGVLLNDGEVVLLNLQQVVFPNRNADMIELNKFTIMVEKDKALAMIEKDKDITMVGVIQQ